jgi:hypothetical protein
LHHVPLCVLPPVLLQRQVLPAQARLLLPKPAQLLLLRLPLLLLPLPLLHPLQWGFPHVQQLLRHSLLLLLLPRAWHPPPLPLPSLWALAG